MSIVTNHNQPILSVSRYVRSASIHTVNEHSTPFFKKLTTNLKVPVKRNFLLSYSKEVSK